MKANSITPNLPQVASVGLFFGDVPKTPPCAKNQGSDEEKIHSSSEACAACNGTREGKNGSVCWKCTGGQW